MTVLYYCHMFYVLTRVKENKSHNATTIRMIRIFISVCIIVEKLNGKQVVSSGLTLYYLCSYRIMKLRDWNYIRVNSIFMYDPISSPSLGWSSLIVSQNSQEANNSIVFKDILLHGYRIVSIISCKLAVWPGSVKIPLIVPSMPKITCKIIYKFKTVLFPLINLDISKIFPCILLRLLQEV